MTLVRPRVVGLIARREFMVRFRTRSFRIATVILVLSAVAMAMLPVIIRLFEGSGGGDRVGIRSETTLATDPVTQFSTYLAVPSMTGTGPAFTFNAVDDVAAARASVDRGDLKALVVITRESAGELAFTIVSEDGPAGRVPTLLRQAAAAMAISDRLERRGLSPAEQAALFAAPPVTVERPSPAAVGAPTGIGEIAGLVVGQVLVIFLFIAIMLYGQWVATSVAEEKSSRVIEVVINAATPSELLGGKVLGVGLLGLTQYGAAVIPAVLALIFQGQLAALFLGGGGESALPDLAGSGLTPGVIAAFGAFFVLGFLLYATLYAAAGSLVSRMEDINSVVGPMTLLSTAGYLVAVYSASGLIPMDAGWVIALSFVPFVSPYLMLSRVVVGAAGPLDVVVAVLLLVVTVAGALWLAARVYSAGILMYGQRAGFRTLLATAFRRKA